MLNVDTDAFVVIYQSLIKLQIRGKYQETEFMIFTNLKGEETCE